MQIVTNLQGALDIDAAVQKLEAVLDPVFILDQAAAIILNNTRKRFLAQVDPAGVAWIPSKAALRRAASGAGGGTLFNTGKLFHSIQLHTVGLLNREISTDVPYAIYHQAEDAHPRRQFLGIADSDLSVIEKFLLKKLEEATS